LAAFYTLGFTLRYRMMDYASFIVRDMKVCGGEPVIRGTRVPLRTVLASLAEGAQVDQILKDFPTLTAEAVRAVIGFAAHRQPGFRRGAS
jgi:uncharacterized protein (DUF433 family)